MTGGTVRILHRVIPLSPIRGEARLSIGICSEFSRKIDEDTPPRASALFGVQRESFLMVTRHGRRRQSLRRHWAATLAKGVPLRDRPDWECATVCQRV